MIKMSEDGLEARGKVIVRKESQDCPGKPYLYGDVVTGESFLTEALKKFEGKIVKIHLTVVK
jgi:hypothetical protein